MREILATRGEREGLTTPLLELTLREYALFNKVTVIRPSPGVAPLHGPSLTPGATAVEPAQIASVAPATVSATLPPSMQAVIADLQTAKISPDLALQRLTEIATHRAGAAPAMRSAIEARVRMALERDPTLSALVRRMGATIHDE
jgi:hypothetical protein